MNSNITKIITLYYEFHILDDYQIAEFGLIIKVPKYVYNPQSLLLDACKLKRNKFLLIMLKKKIITSKSAIDMAAYFGLLLYTKVIHAKYQNVDRSEAILNASYNGHLDVLHFLVNCGKNNTNSLNSALFEACSNGHQSIVAYLIHHGADDFKTALLKASYAGNIDIVRILVNKADNLNEAMLYSIISGKVDVVSYLIECGADDFVSAKKIALSHRQHQILQIIGRAERFKAHPAHTGL